MCWKVFWQVGIRQWVKTKNSFNTFGISIIQAKSSKGRIQFRITAEAAVVVVALKFIQMGEQPHNR